MGTALLLALAWQLADVLVSSILVVAVAFGEGERMALSALIVCLVVQQAEAYVVQPLTQRWAVRLAPGLSVVSVFAFSVLFGLAGAMLAVPLMVLTLVLVQRMVVERDARAAAAARPETIAQDDARAQAVSARRDRPTGT